MTHPDYKPPIPTEHVEQGNLFRWAHYASATQPLLQLLYAIPNGGARHPVVAAKLKAEGVKAGVPDIHLPVPSRGYHGLWIELKRLKGTRPSADQVLWLEALNAQGHKAVWCRGWEAARDEIVSYLKLPKMPEWGKPG